MQNTILNTLDFIDFIEQQGNISSSYSALPLTLIYTIHVIHGYKLDPAQWFLESFRWTKHLMILDINELPWSPSSHHSWHVSTLMIQEIWVHWKFWKHNFCFRGYGESDSPKGREHYKTSLLVNDIKEIVSALTCITETADWMKNLNTKLLRLYISSMRSSVSSPQETLTRELKIQCAVFHLVMKHCWMLDILFTSQTKWF